MSYRKLQLIKSITDNLAFSSKSTSLENVIGLFDSNRIAQDFFAWLFSLIFWYTELKDLDKLNDITNYPAIDLWDENAKIAFQITTRKDSEKIKDTIKKFIFHKLYNKYDRLIIFVIWNKQETYTTIFNTDWKFQFNKDSDIWDDTTLANEISKLDVDQLEKIEYFLRNELLEFKFPENLFPQDIKKCIEILKRDFWSVQSILKIIKRDDDFIENKNKINNISFEFFKEKIRWHVACHNKNIFDFLSDPRNEQIQQDYLNIAEAIQLFYNDPLNNFNSFEEIFRRVYDVSNILYDDNLNKLKILILLHNMYFNCDIGNSPK